MYKKKILLRTWRHWVHSLPFVKNANHLILQLCKYIIFACTVIFINNEIVRYDLSNSVESESFHNITATNPNNMWSRKEIMIKISFKLITYANMDFFRPISFLLYLYAKIVVSEVINFSLLENPKKSLQEFLLFCSKS